MTLRDPKVSAPLLCFSDVLLHHIHAERPDWHSAIDMNPEQLKATRYKLLNLAVSKKALVLTFHFNFPGLGYVAKKGEQWEWRAVDIKG